VALILFLLLIVFPLLDLLLLIVVAGWIGAGWTILEVLVAGVIGSAVLRNWGFSNIHEIQDRLESGWSAQELILDRMLFGAAGVLLLVPGMIGDAIALVLLVPPLRRLIGGLLWSMLGGYLQTHAVFHISTGEPAEFIDEQGGSIDSYVVRRHDDEGDDEPKALQ